MNIQNPVIRGFYPDPSVCRAGETYYLACSSFQYFPGVPLFESSDLVHWKQTGHCLTRESQVNLHKVPSSGGVFAPTLRYHDGRFYMVTNNNTFSSNFYIFTDDISGEWSDPVFVDQEGIDPSLLFDGGRVYFTSNGTGKDGKPCILQCEIDIETGQKLTESIPVWSGSGGRFLESPHLYHIGDWYYLMAAEGGTEYGHMVTYARSQNPYGPYEEYPHNPVLTNRDLGGNLSMIQGIGHGDLVETADGKYYMVCLGFRQSSTWQQYHHLGREVFLVPVQWQEDGWFTAGENGIVREWTEGGEIPPQEENRYDLDFAVSVPDNPRWCYLRDYRKENYRFEEHKLYLRGSRITLDEADSPTFTGVRQSEFDTSFHVAVKGDAKEAGVTFYMDECQHYDLFCKNIQGKRTIVLRIRIGDAMQTLAERVLEGEEKAVLEVVSDKEKYCFYGFCKGEKCFLGKAGTKYLSTEVAGGFTGVVMGLYAVDEEQNWACFSELDWKQGEHHS